MENRCSTSTVSAEICRFAISPGGIVVDNLVDIVRYRAAMIAAFICRQTFSAKHPRGTFLANFMRTIGTNRLSAIVAVGPGNFIRIHPLTTGWASGNCLGCRVCHSHLRLGRCSESSSRHFSDYNAVRVGKEQVGKPCRPINPSGD